MLIINNINNIIIYNNIIYFYSIVSFLPFPAPHVRIGLMLRCYAVTVEVDTKRTNVAALSMVTNATNHP